MATETPTSILTSRVDATSARFEANMRYMADLVSAVRNEEEQIREGGGPRQSKASTPRDASPRGSVFSGWLIPEVFLSSASTPPIACTRNGVARLRQES